MKPSKNIALFIGAREALVLVPYRDGTSADGQPLYAWGLGHNSKAVRPGDKITVADSFKQFGKDLAYWSDVLNKLLKKPIEQHQFDALLSIAYNSGNRYAPALCHLINYKMPPEGVARIIPLLSYTGEGIWSDGIEKRRHMEADIYEKGKYGLLGTIPMWRGNPKTTKREEYTVTDEDLQWL